jgi:hypothetical protein
MNKLSVRPLLNIERRGEMGSWYFFMLQGWFFTKLPANIKKTIKF